MSFRLFVYYCAMCGGFAAGVGFLLGVFSPADAISSAGIKGMFLGVAVAFGLGLLDTIFLQGITRPAEVAVPVGAGTAVGCLGGLIGGMLGQLFYGWSQMSIFFLLGWMFTGLLVGTSIGYFAFMQNILRDKKAPIDQRRLVLVVHGAAGALAVLLAVVALLASGSAPILTAVSVILASISLVAALAVPLVVITPRAEDQQRDLVSSRDKVFKCLGGGAVGGLLGGLLALLLLGAWQSVFSEKNPNELWSPTGSGFVALGMCIGLLVGLAQVILKEAWIRVEKGFRPGRELMLTKETTTVGRAEGCDLGLFGDMRCEKLHARIILIRGQYHVEDSGTPGGTFVNDVRVTTRTPLKAGDLIRVGNNYLRFHQAASRERT